MTRAAQLWIAIGVGFVLLVSGVGVPPSRGAEGEPAKAETSTACPPQIGAVAIQLETKTGKIDGTIDLPAGEGPFPIVIIIAGSGPTDRDGNQIGLMNNSLKMLGRLLAAKGIAVLRYDKRGVGKSAIEGLKEEDMRFEMGVADVVEWIKLLREDRRFSRVTIAGHSEGSLVGMLAAKQAKADAFVALAGCGRPAAVVIREQLARNVSLAFKRKCDPLLDELVAGRTIDDPPKELAFLFRSSVQPYLISYFKYDPAKEIAELTMPVLIVQGTTDQQSAVEDAKLLAAARPGAELRMIEGMGHLLKRANSSLEHWAAACVPLIPVMPEVIDSVADFIATQGKPAD